MDCRLESSLGVLKITEVDLLSITTVAVLLPLRIVDAPRGQGRVQNSNTVREAEVVMGGGVGIWDSQISRNKCNMVKRVPKRVLWRS